MSKTKLAILVLCVAFGVNALGFLFSKKTLSIVEESKKVWLYELPPSASPLDAYPSLDLGPQQGVIGTLLKPNFQSPEKKPDGEVTQTLLADTWTWSAKDRRFTFHLKPNLTYSDGTPILAQHFVDTAKWIAPALAARLNTDSKRAAAVPEWEALAQAEWSAPDALTVVIEWKKSLPQGFEPPRFLKEVLTSSLTGVVHPKNLEALRHGDKITKDWISSGPYKVRKWNPKDIILISRDDFPVILPKRYFRTVNYQSAPVKNPYCDYMMAAPGEEKGLEEHRVSAVDEDLHVFWICRSWQQSGAFCANPENRAKFARLIHGDSGMPSDALAGQKVRYRIPTGSDAFRAKIRKQIETGVRALGGTVEETSYFFKPSTDTDIELEFVLTPRGPGEAEWARILAEFSTRLGNPSGNRVPENLVGEIEANPVNILMKGAIGDPFDRVFLLPEN